MVAACANRSPYNCTAGDQCVLGGQPGFCEAEGFCSFSDPGCDSGRRFEPNAPAGLGGQCTSGSGPTDDAPPATCGAVGQACCSGEPACVDGTFCMGGTCQQCVTDVTIGHRYICQTKYDKTIWCSGENDNGELGNGSTGADQLTPTRVRDAGGPLTDVTFLGAAYDASCAIRENGNVWCWGIGGDGQLGTGGTPIGQTDEPVQVEMQDGMPLTGIVELGGGYGHVCGRDTVGDVWCWGRNGQGQLGNGTNLPANQNFATRVLNTMGGAPFTGATHLIAGGDYTCVTKATDELWCWGADYDGQLGDDMTTNRLVPFMAARTSSASAGTFHLCILNDDTSVSCAGANYHAQVGNGEGGAFNGSDQKTFEKVLAAPGGAPMTGAKTVVAGGPMSCAVMQDDTVKCWGDSFFGQTGTGTGSRVPFDVLVRTATGAKKLDKVDKLVARYPRACAHSQDGTWVCWGRGRSGEFGDDKAIDRGLAEPLTGVTCP
jgi:alpha-tubulin suppressor-like RCC1 family protein